MIKMQKINVHRLTVIRNSCITGKAVWIYQGPSRHAAWKAYRRACIREVERMRNWSQTAAKRRENIRRMLNDCMTDKPFTDTLPDEQKTAARQLIAISKESSSCQSDFYNHIIEERRRQKC